MTYTDKKELINKMTNELNKSETIIISGDWIDINDMICITCVLYNEDQCYGYKRNQIQCTSYIKEEENSW